MNKVKVLALLSLIVCISALSLGLSNFKPDLPLNAFTTWLWMLLFLFGFYGTIASISIALLSFLAIRPSPDNSYIVDRNSLYGRLFLSFVAFNNRDSFSICRAFWITNLILFIGSILIGLVITAGIFIYKTNIRDLAIMTFGILCLGFTFIIFIKLCKLGESAYKRLESSKPKMTDAIGYMMYIFLICFPICVVGIIGYWLYSIGMATIWSWLVIWSPYLAMWTVMICVCIAVIYGIYKIAKKLIGEEFSSFYRQNLCPNIKIR
ncbi:MAG: hypothetical protein Q8L47_00555 [bacterium]|nr:hypothetical protein [bacterium]